jgi:hypothetical protein
LTAQAASVFWQGGANPFVVRARVRRIGPAEAAAERFDLDDFKCAKCVLQIADGVEHILLRTPALTVQLVLQGESFASAPLSATFEIEGLSRAPFVNAALLALARMRTGQHESIDADWSQANLHLRDYLIALDGSLNCASYRQIAQVIYGSERVKDSWSGESRYLKDRIRRAVDRGHELMNGGYLKLLR